MNSFKSNRNLQEDHIPMITDCENREQRLTDWERTFIDSIKEYITKGGFLSNRQVERLNEVWEKATAKG